MNETVFEDVQTLRRMASAPDCFKPNEQAKAAIGRVAAFLTDPKGWPEISEGPLSPAHSPVDRYRCENDDCDAAYSVWEFRPDDYDLDESAVCCPACGEEGELFFRWFRGGDRG